MAKDNQHFFDNPRNIQNILYVFYAGCVLLFILDFIIHRHTYHHWEGLLGFYAIYGTVSAGQYPRHKPTTH